jgi:putative addiction module killer protein
MNTIRIYKSESGQEPFSGWLKKLKDKSARAHIRRRIDRLHLGNEGDHKSVGQGVFELRLAFGPGYRVYYGKANDALVVLLCGGDKSSQSKDIKLAQKYWLQFKENCNVK